MTENKKTYYPQKNRALQSNNILFTTIACIRTNLVVRLQSQRETFLLSSAG
jgi:hypothetical protein